MPICTLPLQFFFSCHHIDSFFKLYFIILVWANLVLEILTQPQRIRRGGHAPWPRELLRGIVAEQARLSCLGSRLSRNKHKWGFLGKALGIRSCEEEAELDRGRSWTAVSAFSMETSANPWDLWMWATGRVFITTSSCSIDVVLPEGGDDLECGRSLQQRQSL